MKELIPMAAYIRRYITLSEEEEEFLYSLLRITHVKKRQAIVQPEFVCKYRSYILKGTMRAYFVNRKGEEFTIALGMDDWWISDYGSYINQQPATLFVEALEDTDLIQIDYNAEQLLMEKYPRFERFFRIITQRSFSFLQQRMLASLSKTAEERYEEFAARYPELLSRVPQYVLASYLGMTSEFLSKIRNRRVKKLN
jgi:CRP-like cAMP-binding protein